MNDYTIIKQIALGPRHIPTGKTRHTNGIEELPHPTVLKMVQYTNDAGFYLIRFDSNGKEITDTFHKSTEDAMAQAEFEYQVKQGEWSEGLN